MSLRKNENKPFYSDSVIGYKLNNMPSNTNKNNKTRRKFIVKPVTPPKTRRKFIVKPVTPPKTRRKFIVKPVIPPNN